tara:strand:+ start:372 stop:1280 length:909 start_codon:yes stop_codon:yes gene_type:complete
MSTDKINNNLNIRIMSSRHSAFYTPLLLAVESLFSNDNQIDCTYSVAEENQSVYEKLLTNKIDIGLVDISDAWINRNLNSKIIHFAQINKMNGSYLLRRISSNISDNYNWEELINKSIIIDNSIHGTTSFKYACFKKNVDPNQIKILDLGSSETMIENFKNGIGDYIQLEGPHAQQLEYEGYGNIVSSIGKTVGPLSTTTLICNSSFINSNKFREFLLILDNSKNRSQTELPEKIAEIVFEFFPDIEFEVLSKTISHYQDLNCWNSTVEIKENHYDYSLEIFQQFGLTGIHPFSEIVCKNIY